MTPHHNGIIMGPGLAAVLAEAFLAVAGPRLAVYAAGASTLLLVG